MASLKFKKGDRVVVLTGRDQGKQGDILTMFPKENRAIVRGVNIVRRHTRQSASEDGGIISKESKVDLSNLAHIDPSDDKPTRVGFKMVDGRKVRYAKRSGELIPDRM